MTIDRARAPLPDRVDVAIVGAGLGGLIAAANLAQAGRRVAVFDAHYVAGGCATMFTRRAAGARFQFDVGLHYIGDCGPDGVIPGILRTLGIELEYAPLDPDGFDTLVFPDFRFRIPANLETYRDRLVDQFPREKRGIDTYVRFLREVDRLKAKSSGNAPAKGKWGMLLDVALHGRLAAKYRTATMGQLLADTIRDPQLAAVILGQSGDYGLPPSRVSALLHAGLATHYFHGAFYPVGGGQVIADRLCEHIEAHGGSVHLRTPVERIVVENGRAVGVRLGGPHHTGAEVRAPVTVSGADLKRTLLELVEPTALPSGVAERVRAYEMAAALFIVFLGVKGDLRQRGLSNTNYWSFDGYDVEAFYADGASGKLDANGAPRIGGSYITSASLKDPGTAHHAPPGHGTVEIMAVVPSDSSLWGIDAGPGQIGERANGASSGPVGREPRGLSIEGWRYRKSAAYLDRKQKLEDALIARYDRLFPGAAADIVYRESATPVTHARFTRASAGTGYGLACTPAQFMEGRPGYRGPIPGLYLCGASTRAGHGIAGAMMSGVAVAKRVTRDSAI